MPVHFNTITHSTNITDLPQELLLSIFFFLTGDNWCIISRVCKQWHKILSNNDSQKRLHRNKKQPKKDVWMLLSEQHFKEALKRRKTYPSEISTKDFYVLQLQNFLRGMQYNMEKVIRSLEHEFESNRLFKDVCVFCPDLFVIYLKVFKIDKFFDGVWVAHHPFEIAKLNFDKRGNLTICWDRFGGGTPDNKLMTVIVKPNDSTLAKKILKKKGIVDKNDYQKIGKEIITRSANKIYVSWSKKFKSIASEKKEYKKLFSGYNFEKINVTFTEEGLY